MPTFVRFKLLTIFLDLNGVTIENADRDMFTAEFHRAVTRGDPALESRILAFIIYGNLDVGSFKWTNSDAIWRA